LDPKAVDVLLILVEKRGELVDWQDLMSAVWPDTFVEESNLSSNISILRRQLGMTPDDLVRPLQRGSAPAGEGRKKLQIPGCHLHRRLRR
jgi:DNA-binding winged helix-turn-helix (wHTH) protein